jgi:hypothetical protein
MVLWQVPCCTIMKNGFFPYPAMPLDIKQTSLEASRHGEIVVVEGLVLNFLA